MICVGSTCGCCRGQRSAFARVVLPERVDELIGRYDLVGAQQKHRYLSDTDADNGALRVLPHSHLRATPLHATLPEAHHDGSSDERAAADVPDQMTLAVSACD